ncbi:MAG: glucuronate isomerase [Christensenellales bacterium]|jgi:glucuronate isomerase
MRPFMDENFMLHTEAAQKLYFEAAQDMPIYDYHCHLPVKDIAQDVRFDNIGQMMLGGDHYKWRAMDAFGIDDRYVRGDATDYEKFMAYAKMLPLAIGNPLYHWTHMELARAFDIHEPLNEKSAPSIWERANARLKEDAFSARGLINKFRVKLICTTDDPADNIPWHRQIAQDASFPVKVLPSFRPDSATCPEKAGFAAYIEKLSHASGVSIRCADDVLAALEKRLDFFHENGARISDHGLNRVVYAPYDKAAVERAFAKGLRGEEVDSQDLASYKTHMLTNLGAMYAERDWTQQYHMNALRSNNSRMFAKHGPDTGYDSVADAPLAEALSRLLDEQDVRGALPRTILYTLNPSDNYVLASMAGNFQGGTPGKMQFGSGWWFCDQQYGMKDQMRALASIGLLGTFVGMLTDSRSFLSYPRHEYFRRILCDIIGGWVENGEYPADWDTLYALVRGICYDNAVEYFRIPV